MTYTITKNNEYNSVEISFDGKPAQAVRDALKALRFRWHGVKKVWYGYTTEEAARAAIEGKKTVSKAIAKPQTANKFGVCVGDIFSASWGYEQTNIDFFQVVELVGASSVRVREVRPEIASDEATGPMSACRVYKLTRELLPPVSRSVFINDQERGDLKRLKSYAADGKSDPQFNLSSYANAYLCTGDTCATYESWYY